MSRAKKTAALRALMAEKLRVRAEYDHQRAVPATAYSKMAALNRLDDLTRNIEAELDRLDRLAPDWDTRPLSKDPVWAFGVGTGISVGILLTMLVGVLT